MKFALAGNPNSGKTTLFNLLTGSTAHVGNWPGVTVDKCEGVYKKLAERVDIVDLPGIYSLSPYTPEEVVSRRFLLEESPDCIINIIDATNLERNLYLTTQLLELDTPVVVALNMMDAVEKRGDRLNVQKLGEVLGVPVVEISALKGRGVTELLRQAYEAAKKPRKGRSVLSDGKYGDLYRKVLALFDGADERGAAFRAVKLIEGDEIEKARRADFATAADEWKKGVDTGDFEGDFEGVVADARYSYIASRMGGILKKKSSEGLTKSDKIDRVLTHRIWGIPLFLLIMLAVFHCTFSENFLGIGWFIPEGTFDIPVIGTDTISSPGVMLANLVTWGTDSLLAVISGAMPAGTWYTSLVCDGLLSGVFAVLSFIPQIMVLFLFLSVLEDSGYMARVAFIMDRAFRRFGLSGKAFMPLIMCFGCAVPGIMATRTLEDETERRRTVMLAPFFSCGAKLPIWAAFGGVFAHQYASLNGELVVYAMYLLGIGIAVVSSLLLKKTIVKGDVPPFIMELPAYHTPQLRNTAAHLWDKLKHYLFRAATIIAGATVVIWFLTTFSFAFRMVEDSGDSIIGVIAQWFSWLFIPLGFGMGENGWKFVVAAFTGLLAKEMVVATMGTFAGIEDEALDSSGDELASTALGAMILGIGGSLGGYSMAVPAMFAFMAFNLLSVPCMAAVGAANGELRKKRHLWTAIVFWMLTAYIVSAVLFWFGALVVVCWWAALIVGLAALAAAIVFPVLKAKGIIGRGRRQTLSSPAAELASTDKK